MCKFGNIAQYKGQTVILSLLNLRSEKKKSQLLNAKKKRMYNKKNLSCQKPHGGNDSKKIQWQKKTKMI